ncbi:MAG: hypothetical protein WCX84_04830, partial [Syntrophales bacterium]
DTGHPSRSIPANRLTLTPCRLTRICTLNKPVFCLDYGEKLKVDISDVFDESQGDQLGVSAEGGHAKLTIFDSANNEKGSITFDNIDYSDLSDLGVGNELDSLLGKVDIDDGTP